MKLLTVISICEITDVIYDHQDDNKRYEHGDSPAATNLMIKSQ